MHHFAMALLPVSFAGFAIAQAAPATPWVQDGMQFSALALMGWALWYLLSKEMPKKREDFNEAITAQRISFTETLDKMSERHDRWETLRHQDSEKLDSTLRNLTENCAATRTMSQSEIRRRMDDTNIHG